MAVARREAFIGTRMPLRQHRRRFDLNFRFRLHERHHLHDAHHRKMLSHHRAIGGADVTDLGVVFIAARDIPGESHDVLRFAAGFCEHGDDVFQRLLHLSAELFAREASFGIPADLAGDVDLPALLR